MEPREPREPCGVADGFNALTYVTKVHAGPSRFGVDEAFSLFFSEVEPPLRRALIASLGPERGREAASEALSWAWEHRDRLQTLDNPVAYLYRVGQSRTRVPKRRFLHHRPEEPDLWVEPALGRGLAALPERQRVAVILAFGYGWTHSEIGDLLGIRASTVQNHVERGMRRLRECLEARNED